MVVLKNKRAHLNGWSRVLAIEPLSVYVNPVWSYPHVTGYEVILPQQRSYPLNLHLELLTSLTILVSGNTFE